MNADTPTTTPRTWRAEYEWRRGFTLCRGMVEVCATDAVDAAEAAEERIAKADDIPDAAVIRELRRTGAV